MLPRVKAFTAPPFAILTVVAAASLDMLMIPVPDNTPSVPPLEFTLIEPEGPACKIDEEVVFVLPNVRALAAPPLAIETVVAATSEEIWIADVPEAIVIAPVVTLKAFPAVKAVVDAMVPGAKKVLGMERVIVLAAPVVVIWLVVPRMFMFPVVGLRAPPESPVRVAIIPVPGVIVPVRVEPDPAKERVPAPVIVIFPAVGERAPPDVPVMVETKAVPGVMVPVNVEPAPAKAKAPAPRTLILPPEGSKAPPLLPVIVFTSEAPPPTIDQVLIPPDFEAKTHTSPDELRIPIVPTLSIVSFVEGALEKIRTLAGFGTCPPP